MYSDVDCGNNGLNDTKPPYSQLVGSGIPTTYMSNHTFR